MKVVVGVLVVVGGTSLSSTSTHARLLFFHSYIIFSGVGSLPSGFYEEQSLAEFCHPFYPLIVFFWVGSIASF